MRHLGSLLAGLLIAPAAWVLLAAGQPRTTDTFQRWSGQQSVYTGDLLVPLALVIAAGVLIGLLGTLRWSPLGPLVAGLLLLAGYGWALAQPFQVVRDAPVWRVPGTAVRVALATPLLNGTAGLLGAALVVAVFSRRRWQRWPAPALAAPAAEPGDAAPGSGPTLGSSLTNAFVPLAPGPQSAEDLPRRIPQPAGAATGDQSAGGLSGGWPTLETLSRAGAARQDQVPPRATEPTPLRKPRVDPRLNPSPTSPPPAGQPPVPAEPGGFVPSARHAVPDAERPVIDDRPLVRPIFRQQAVSEPAAAQLAGPSTPDVPGESAHQDPQIASPWVAPPRTAQE